MFNKLSPSACKCGSTSFAGTFGYDSPSPAEYTALQMDTRWQDGWEACRASVAVGEPVAELSTYCVGLIKFCEPTTALRYLVKRLRETGISSTVADDYAESIEFLLAHRDDLGPIEPLASTSGDEALTLDQVFAMLKSIVLQATAKGPDPLDEDKNKPVSISTLLTYLHKRRTNPCQICVIEPDEAKRKSWLSALETAVDLRDVASYSINRRTQSLGILWERGGAQQEITLFPSHGDALASQYLSVIRPLHEEVKT